MQFPHDFWELIAIISLFLIGEIIYALATRNRGSFADTPDWSKVIRRIIELACVLMGLLFIGFVAWKYGWYIGILTILLPLAGIVLGFYMPGLVTWITKRKKKGQPFKDNLAEHLLNAVILAIFLLSALLIGFITMARAFHEGYISCYFLIILDFMLSVEFALLFYQLYYLIFINNIPSEEIVQIVKICKELNG